MTNDLHPELTGEQEREDEAASAGIEARAAVLDIDTDDGELEPGEPGDAHNDDDEAVEDVDDSPVESDV
jgi:hypothetical protein